MNNKRPDVPPQPIESIEWRPAKSLTANAWNPNLVHKPELALLEESILRNGWIQPVLISPQGSIIDGFHRWRLSSESKAIRAIYGGLVPCAVLDVSEAEAKMLTVRINRAKGSHVAVRLADLVKSVVDEGGLSLADVAKGIGASEKEAQLLYDNNVFKSHDIEHWQYSPAWEPRESKNDPQ